MGIKITEITRCRICGNQDIIPILNLGVQALSGRFPRQGESDPPSGPLELVKCNNSNNPDHCGLLQLKHSVSPDEMYKHDYGYRSGINKTMILHLKGIVERIEQMVPLNQEDIVLDIGSNDSTLLKGYQTKGLTRIGIDPTGEQFKEFYPPDIRLVSDFFNVNNFETALPGKLAKVITSIAMFYDLESPMDFVSDIRKCLHPDGIWVFEQSYMPTMLRMNSFDTICHEHLEYYALNQIDWILKRNRLKILDVELNDINGGSFRVYASHDSAKFKPNIDSVQQVFAEEKQQALDTDQPYLEFKDRVFCLRDELFQLLTREKKNGKKIMIYGASTKGNVTLQFCNIDSSVIIAAAERNPDKYGRRTPGTNIPIISEEEARQQDPDYFLVLPWHFREEFIKRERDYLDSGGKLIFPLPDIEIVG